MENKKEKQKINPSERFIQNLNILLTVNKELMAEINSLRRNVIVNNGKIERIEESGIPEEYWEELGYQEEVDDYDEESFKSKISRIRIKYNLSPAYQKYLEDLTEFPAGTKVCYLYPSENLPEHLMPFGIENPDNPKEWLSVLAITPETNPEDIQKYWKKIKSIAAIWDKRLKVKVPKSCSRLNLKRDLEIYELKLQGKKSENIASIINKKYPGTLGYQDVNMIIKRLRDRADAITKPKMISS